MAITSNTYTGNGSNKLFSITFPYLEESDVDVYLNGTLQTITTQYSFANATTIEFVTAPANGATVKLDRSTDDSDNPATFFPGSSIKANDLNANFDQTLYVVQEINNNAVKLADPLYVNKTYIDAADATKVNKSGDTMTGNLAMSGNRVTGLGTPSLDADSATKLYVDQRYGELGVPGLTRWRKIATAGQTVFSGVGEDGNTLAYSSSRESVFINGAYQQRGVDYTANDGSSITVTPALIVGDVVDVHCVNNAAGVATDQASGVYFTQSGAGAATRTVDSKLKDVVSVKDFGAVGDGVADDTAAIQAAINYVQSFYIPETYASASPGPGVTELFFPFGVYKITAALTVTRSMSFRGEGHSEFSTGARIIQYTNATDHFRVNPIAQGCSVSWDDLTMTANGGGGTGGACINITKTTATCNSVRIRRCTFGTPQSLAIKLQSSDDVMIGENLFDVSASNCISLGTSTATDVVSNCQIIGNTFYSILGVAILPFNVDGLVVSKNRVYPAATKLTKFLDGYNTLPYQLKDITVTSNVLKGITCLAHLTSVNGFVFQGNVGSALGAGAGASLSCIELTGTCSGIVISGNVLSGSFDTKNFYNGVAATTTKAAIYGNSLINTAGSGAALVPGTTTGFIGQNSVSGFASPSVGDQFYTTGNAISVGVISSLAAATYTTNVTGAAQGDKVTLTPASTTWPIPAGVEVSAFISAANTVSIRYVNVTGSPIGVGAHDFGILVTR